MILDIRIKTFAFAFAYLEACVVNLFSQKARRWVTGIIVVVYNVLIVADYYCLIMFGQPIRQYAVDVLLLTNINEVRNFAATYFTHLLLISFFAAIVAIDILVCFAAKALRKIRYVNICLLLSFSGLFILVFSGFNLITFNKCKSIPQYHVLTRIPYSIYNTRQRVNEVKQLIYIANTLKCTQIGEKHTFVVVIGESHSIYHSQLYGYRLPNQPRLQALKDKGDLIVFNDVVSTHDNTGLSLPSLFSMDSLTTNFGYEPLFPMCFKAAGYKTMLLENDFLEGGLYFLEDIKLLDAMYDSRSQRLRPYDEDLLKDLKILDEPALYVIHLMGQHYDYPVRYPQSFAKFNAGLYKGKKDAEDIAAYDNAVYYNDYVMSKIIDLFKDRDACLIYISDHGEDVYDTDGFHGHGGAAIHDPKYELRIPMYIIPSRKFRENQPELVERMRKSVDVPIAQDDFCHLLLDVAGIRNKWFNETRSALSPKYIRKHRIVLGSVDIDEQ